MSVPDCGDDKDHARQEARLESSKQKAARHGLAVILAEARSDCSGAPTDNGNTEDSIGTETLDRDDPKNVTNDVGDLVMVSRPSLVHVKTWTYVEESDQIVELLPLEFESLRESKDSGVAYFKA